MTNVLVAPRNFLHNATDWKAAGWAGVIAGMLFLALEMTLTWVVQGQSPWTPFYRLAATLMGSDVMPVLGAWAVFDAKVLTMALLVHVPVVILCGLCGGWLMHRFDWLGAFLLGTGLGLSVYLINVYVVAPTLFPWFDALRSWVGVVSHLVFGLALGLTYMALRKPQIPFNYLD